MELKDKQYVRHSKFGWGTILDRDERYTWVFFYTVGVRKLTQSEAVFEVVEDRVSLKRRVA